MTEIKYHVVPPITWNTNEKKENNPFKIGDVVELKSAQDNRSVLTKANLATDPIMTVGYINQIFVTCIIFNPFTYKYDQHTFVHDQIKSITKL